MGHSCDCVPPSQDAICLPHRRLPQDRAFEGEFEGTGHHPDSRANPEDRGRDKL